MTSSIRSFAAFAIRASTQRSGRASDWAAEATGPSDPATPGSGFARAAGRPSSDSTASTARTRTLPSAVDQDSTMIDRSAGRSAEFQRPAARFE